jgi:hypothetical protein
MMQKILDINQTYFVPKFKTLRSAIPREYQKVKDIFFYGIGLAGDTSTVFKGLEAHRLSARARLAKLSDT